MSRNKTQRMSRVLKVLRSLRQSEEARLVVLERRSIALKSAQTSAIAKLNEQYDDETPYAAGFSMLLARQIRSSAAKELEAEQQAEWHRQRLAQRRGHERITKQFVDERNQADDRAAVAIALQDVIEAYRGKPAASKV